VSITLTPTYDIETKDVEYLRHGSDVLQARIIRPMGDPPFPAMVDVHGGAWVSGDRTRSNETKKHIAGLGMVVISIDFRMPPVAGYPSSVADVNFAVRWAKANADSLGTLAEMVGITGNSSGGHLAALSAMRPDDPRYNEIPNLGRWPQVDARVRWMIPMWPVISPLGRYRYAKQMLKEGRRKELTDLALPGHEQFWVTEDAMAEGDPVLALERGERCELPPVLCIQGSSDSAHPFAHLGRFVDLYTLAGGQIDLAIIPVPHGESLGAVLEHDPTSSAALGMFQRIAEFVGGVISGTN
jgi:acetyl esterase